MLYKDSCNKKSNQKNIGTIKSSNLCCEIIEYSDKNESAVCNLASISLSTFVKSIPYKIIDSITIITKPSCKWCVLLKAYLTNNNIHYIEDSMTDAEFTASEHNTVPQVYDGDTILGGYHETLAIFNKSYFDFTDLCNTVKLITENLNKVIDINYYPTDKTQKSNMSSRPIGIGVQGLADTFAMLNIPFDSSEARHLNVDIFETIYYSSIHTSMKISEQLGPYTKYEGSPISKGLFQFDLWNVTPSDRYDWDELRQNITTHGVRNSLCVAPMPTASTSQILSNNECFEPFTSNIYTRRTLAGEFIITNKHLMKELCELNLWNPSIKEDLIRDKGSVQNISSIPQYIKDKYKIVWEMSMKSIIDMSKDRGAFICQSQSLNLWIQEPNYKNLTSMHMYAWKSGLKTGCYYLRRKGKHQAQQFTVKPKEEEECLSCGS
jgi:ribonucleoside-diphosphate reductase alpha subunit